MIVEAVEDITNTPEQNKYVVGIFFHFKKAFDTINHYIWLDKLEKIWRYSHDWVKGYLNGWKQHVKMGH